MTYKPVIDHEGRPMITHGDIADALEAAGQAMMPHGGISQHIGIALGCIALEFAKKHEFILREVWKQDRPWTLEEYKAQRERHDLYQTGDEDAPDSIKDRNGEVVLALCRKCGRGEVMLNEHPVCTPL